MTNKIRNKKYRDVTAFSEKWGIRSHELAEQEGCTPDAINMRVHLYGTPFQRKRRPTKAEILHGKTTRQIADEIPVHPVTVQQRLTLYADAYRVGQRNHLSGRFSLKESAQKRRESYRSIEWLHPSHPDYDTWREQPKWIAERERLIAEAAARNGEQR